MDVGYSEVAGARPAYLNQLPEESGATVDLTLIESMADGLRTRDGKEDRVGVGIDSLYKSLTISAQKVVEKLNELLKGSLPNGIESLKPEEVTPDATAERIVRGATGFFGVFAQQHPELEGEELLNKFLSTIQGGIETGYNQAVGILGDLGAFEFDGVKSGIEETKRLIGEKLADYEKKMRVELGIDPVEDVVAGDTRDTFLRSTGRAIAAVA
jgi:hypothetical protein